MLRNMDTEANMLGSKHITGSNELCSFGQVTEPLCVPFSWSIEIINSTYLKSLLWGLICKVFDQYLAYSMCYKSLLFIITIIVSFFFTSHCFLSILLCCKNITLNGCALHHICTIIRLNISLSLNINILQF